EALYEGHVRRRLLCFDVRLPGDDYRCVGEGHLYGVNWPRASGEITVVVFDPEDRGKGIGTEAASLLCAYAFDGLGFNRISWRFPADNAAATAASERAGPGSGARHVGIEREAEWAFGAHRDIAVWEVLGREFP